MENVKSQSGMVTITSLSQLAKIGFILSNIRQELRDGTVSLPIQLYFIPRTIPTRLLLRLQDELTDLTPDLSIYITIISNQRVVSIWRYPRPLMKSDSLTRAALLNGEVCMTLMKSDILMRDALLNGEVYMTSMERINLLRPLYI